MAQKQSPTSGVTASMGSETSSEDREYREGETLLNDLEDDAVAGMNIYALFVLDASVPSTTINKVFRDAYEDTHFDCLWLAEDYDNIDVECGDTPGLLDRNHHHTTIGPDWRSPWAGKDLHEAAKFVRNAPKPPKALNKVFFVILDKEQYEAHEWLTVCKIVEGEVQGLACVASNITSFLDGHDRDTWPDTLENWQRDGIPAMN